MKLSENKTIKSLNILSSIILGFYIIFLATKLFTVGAPNLSKSIKGYTVYNLTAKPIELKQSRTLKEWFTNTTIVEPTYNALVETRFKSYGQLFSLPALSYQLSQLAYWLFIGYLILCIKLLFDSLSKDRIFTTKNTVIINSAGITLLALPAVNWLSKELFINCILKLNLNDSNYAIQNSSSLIGPETLFGFALLAFGLAFREGVNLRNENEAFI